MNETVTMTENTPSIRAAFAAEFGDDMAAQVVYCAEEHETETNCERGSDPFKWALAICIGYDCFKLHEPINALGEERVREWVLMHGDLASHDGGLDLLSAFAGRYEGWYQTGHLEP